MKIALILAFNSSNVPALFSEGQQGVQFVLQRLPLYFLAWVVESGKRFIPIDTESVNEFPSLASFSACDFACQGFEPLTDIATTNGCRFALPNKIHAHINKWCGCSAEYEIASFAIFEKFLKFNCVDASFDCGRRSFDLGHDLLCRFNHGGRTPPADRQRKFDCLELFGDRCDCINVGTTESVDSLVFVANKDDLRPMVRGQFDQRDLDRIEILTLVDQNQVIPEE